MKLKKLSIYTQTFSKLIKDDAIYVDKTKIIHELVVQKGYYFLSRPRRFGKSLLISTFKDLFLGNKELFKDLWICKNTDYSFEEYPVIHLDFSAIPKETPELLERGLITVLKNHSKTYGIEIVNNGTAAETFGSLVLQLSKKKNVVLLVDEYDDPIVRHITDLEKAGANRKVLQAFYKMVKSLDAHLHFVFITGISKFSKTSIFSGMNNLVDISLRKESSTLLGYTREELIHYFEPHITALSGHLELSQEETLAKLKNYYNGYRFSRRGELVYNPFSILHALQTKEINNYWFESGTPTFLVELLKGRDDVAQEIATLKKGYLRTTELVAFDLKSLPIKTLLFQTGYLTITDYDEERNEYTVGYPNKEVEDSLQLYLMLSLTDVNIEIANSATRYIRDSLYEEDFAAVVFHIQTLLAGIPYHQHIPNERYYHTLLHLIFTLSNVRPESEVSTSNGRIDMVIHTPRVIYILEFKYDHSVEKALSQIETKRYAEKYRLEGKKIIAVGLSFSSSDKKLTLDYEEEVLY